MSASEVFFWKKENKFGNFGDSLTLVFTDRLFSHVKGEDWHEYHLIGSVITEKRIREVLTNAKGKGGSGRAVFWGCGKKDATPLGPKLLESCEFLGVRGTLTRDALGLPKDTPLGDPALALPRLYTPQAHPATTGKVLWVPHVHSSDPTEAELAGAGDSVVMRPTIPNKVSGCLNFIDAIASAKFVMANAMHSAIVALAYGVPFCFWSGSQIDNPFKWDDFSSAAGFRMGFSDNYTDGQAMFDRVRPDKSFADFSPDPILSVAPFPLK